MQTISTLVELAGLAAIVVGAYLADPALLIVLGGAVAVGIGDRLGNLR